MHDYCNFDYGVIYIYLIVMVIPIFKISKRHWNHYQINKLIGQMISGINFCSFDLDRFLRLRRNLGVVMITMAMTVDDEY